MSRVRKQEGVFRRDALVTLHTLSLSLSHIVLRPIVSTRRREGKNVFSSAHVRGTCFYDLLAN